MGLHLCYELSLAGTISEQGVAELISSLHAKASGLPVARVSGLVRADERALDAPWPIRGLTVERLSDVVLMHGSVVREELRARRRAPSGAGDVAIGFAIAPGRGCEPASFGLARLGGSAGGGAGGDADSWWWHGCCKTQYASAVSDEHLLRCHASLVAVLDEASALGFGLEVRDETGYYMSRDERMLLASVAEMNRTVARFAGRFTDAARAAGVESRRVGGAIFGHPDFERLETEAEGREE